MRALVRWVRRLLFGGAIFRLLEDIRHLRDKLEVVRAHRDEQSQYIREERDENNRLRQENSELRDELASHEPELQRLRGLVVEHCEEIAELTKANAVLRADWKLDSEALRKLRDQCDKPGAGE